MKMSEIIEKISELYREEHSKCRNFQKEFNEVSSKLAKAEYDGGKNITYDEYQFLKARRTALRQIMHELNVYYEGISAVRELLMDLGFETEVA